MEKLKYICCQFKSGDMSIEDKPNSTHTSTLRIDKRQSIDQLSKISALSWSLVHWILTKIWEWKRLLPSFFLGFLLRIKTRMSSETCRILKHQLDTAQIFCQRPFITGDIVTTRNIATVKLIKAVIITIQKKCLHFKSNIITMLICFFHAAGVVHSNFVLQVRPSSKDFLEFSEDWATVLVKKDSIFSKQEFGSFIRTMHLTNSHLF